MNTRFSLQPRFYLIFAVCSAVLLHFICFGFVRFSFPNKSTADAPSVFFLGSILRKGDLLIARNDNRSYQENLEPVPLNFTPVTDTGKTAISEAPHKPFFSQDSQDEKKQAYKPFWAKTQAHKPPELPSVDIETTIPPPEPLKLPNP